MSEETNNVEIIEDDMLAEEYVSEELAATNKSLKNTQIWGSLCVFGIMCWMFSIANGFASNLSPDEAAKITKGLIVQRLDEAQPEISGYLSREIPSLIESIPDHAKDQLPIMRESLEDTLENELNKLASETSDDLDKALDAFLLENEEQFKTIILAGQDKETTDEVAQNLRYMFEAYLTETPDENGESIQDKLDKSLAALQEVERKTNRLASASNLDASEMKQRRAIACLFTTVQENKGNMNIISKEDAQAAVQSVISN